jgi:hypothetical protein
MPKQASSSFDVGISDTTAHSHASVQIKSHQQPANHPSADRLNRVLDSVNVDKNFLPKVDPKTGKAIETYCNTFVIQATKKLGTPIPDTTSSKQPMTANRMETWLNNQQNGWKKLPSVVNAMELANKGYTVIAVW